MAVRINQTPPLAFASGQTGPLLQFSDSFLRLTGIGVNWCLGYSDPNQVGWYNSTGGITTGVTNGLQLRNPTGGGSQATFQISNLLLGAVMGLTQFAEFQVTSSIGVAGWDAGPSVAMSGDSSIANQNGYYLQVLIGGSVGLTVCNIGGRSVQAGVTTWVVGTLLRLSVQFQASQNIIKVFQNGVLATTVTDNNAARPTTGLPGIWNRGEVAGNSIFFANWRGGFGQGS